ncbi:MAG: DUF1800 family protein, partial [Planctomycetota bacterium]
MNDKRLASRHWLLDIKPMMFALAVLPMLTPSVAAAPEASSVRWEIDGRGAEADLALTGSASIETRVVADDDLLFRVEFSEAVLSLGPVSCTGGIINNLDFIPGQSSATISVRPNGVSGYVIVSLQDVRSSSGTLGEMILPLGVLAGDSDLSGSISGSEIQNMINLIEISEQQGDLDGNGVPDSFDLLAMLRSADEGLPQVPPVVGKVNELALSASEQSSAIAFDLRDISGSGTLSVAATSSDQAVVHNNDITLTETNGRWSIQVQGSAVGNGTATITIIAQGDGGSTEQPFGVTIAPNSSPVARMLLPQYLGVAPLAVMGDARESFDPEGSSLIYSWDFGDGSTAMGPAVNHTFTSPGQHVVRLTVTDAGGLSSIAERTVSVSDGSFNIHGPVSESEARRFLWQAAFGPRDNDVADVMNLGYSGWIDSQITMNRTPITYALGVANKDRGYDSDRIAHLFDDYACEAPDQLRQRAAWALIQIIVLNGQQASSGTDGDYYYYDNYLAKAFGSYRDLLEWVTYTYQMGTYLTYHDSRKADEIAGTFPDENYAREIIQLFTIGLWELYSDGTEMRDGGGDRIPTFDNEDIKQFARVFTGFRRAETEYHFWDTTPMYIRADRHEFGAKQLLDYPGVFPVAGLIPASSVETEAVANTNVDTAIDNLFYHPNCAPFICKQLIMRFVTSNPTPAYVQRVVDVFDDDGAGNRGNLGAVIKAILLDREARDPAYRPNPASGKVIEPIIAVFGVYRALERAHWHDDVFPHRVRIAPWDRRIQTGQNIMESPSVFNFYQPDYTIPNTDLERNRLVAPELQIHDALTAISVPNLTMSTAIRESDPGQVSPKYAEWLDASRIQGSGEIDRAALL